MTKKQIERMGLFLALAAMDAERTGDATFYKRKLKQANELFNLMFDLYVEDDYKKIEKIRTAVFKAAQAKLDEMQAENAA